MAAMARPRARPNVLHPRQYGGINLIGPIVHTQGVIASYEHPLAINEQKITRSF